MSVQDGYYLRWNERFVHRMSVSRGEEVEWEKASPEMSEILARAAEPFALVERRKMFGGLSLFINGHMFAGVHGSKIVLKLGEDERVRALADAGAMPFEPMPGRVMKEYVVVPEAVWSDPRSLEEWIGRSVEFVAALPPKAARSKIKTGAKAGAS
jgi:TfoX/Sxy family transcriptional regulator of competence genes